MSESTNGTTPPPELEVVCAPVVIFTKDDADKLASFVPAKAIKKHKNAILVAAMATPESLACGCADVFIAHHAENLAAKKAKVVGQWTIRVPVLPLDFKGGSLHVFRVNLERLLPPSALDPKDSSPDSDAKKEPDFDVRSGGLKIPGDILTPSVN